MRLRRLALMFVFVLTACGDSTPTTTPGTGGTFTPQDPKFGPNNQPSNNGINNMTVGSNNGTTGTNNGTTATNNGTTSGMMAGRFCGFEGTFTGGLAFGYVFDNPVISCASNTTGDQFNSIAMIDTLANNIRVTVEPMAAIGAGEMPTDLTATVTVTNLGANPEENWSSETCAITVTSNVPGMNQMNAATTRIEADVVCSTPLAPEAPNANPPVGISGMKMRTQATF